VKNELSHSYIDFANALGKRQYQVRDQDYEDLMRTIDQHPLARGIIPVGPYFFMVGNVQTWKTLYLSEGVEQITGYSVKEGIEMGPELLVRFLHPEDYAFAMQTNQKAIEVLYQKPIEDRAHFICSFYYRGVRKDGKTISIQHQIFPIGFDIYGNPYIFALILTDISHLNMQRNPRTVIIDRKRNQLQVINPGDFFIAGKPLKFSKREKEVLRLLASGNSSKIIAEKLNLSFHTIVTYRKRLLEKTGVKNTTELVNFAIINALM
jgi:DNA-binding CsgD family transcriptional regulator